MSKIQSFILTPLVLALPFILNGPANISPPTSEAVGVLFDTGHQKDASDISGYSSMINDATSQGFHFTEDSDGDITDEDLNGKHVLVIVEPDTALSTSEIDTIHSFIASGHSLFVMSDELDENARAAINTLLSPYGIRQSDILSSSGIYTDITSHAVTDGVSRYGQDDAGAKLDVVDSQTSSLIRDDDGDTLLAAWNGGARVVVISDESSLRRTRYNSTDKSILMRSIFNWLSEVEPPVADFSAQPTAGGVLLEIQFTDKSVGDISNWQWDFGDGMGSSEQNPSHAYNNIGRYSVRLQVTGPDGADMELKHNYIDVVDVSGGVAEVEVAEFAISSINIEPSHVLPYEVVTVSVNVVNRGGTSGNYQVVLNINGKLEDRQLISLSPDSSRRVVFNIIRTIPGVYDVLIEGQKGRFTVTASPTNASATNSESTAPADSGLSLQVIMSIILGSAGVAISVFIITKRRRRTDYLQDLEEKYQKVLDDLNKMRRSFRNKE